MINLLEETFMKVEPGKPLLSTGGYRFNKKIPLSDVCLIGRRPDGEAYRIFCEGFIGKKEVGIPAMEPGEFRYIPELNIWTHIPAIYESIEQTMNKAVNGTNYSDLKHEIHSGMLVRDFVRTDSGGHPDKLGMLDQHNKRKSGRAIFNASFDESGKIIESESYTPRQMKAARVPYAGDSLAWLYPEAYERAFSEPLKAKELKEVTGYESIDEASWINLKEFGGFEWSLGKISSSGRITEYPDEGRTFNRKPFNRARSAALITVHNNGKWTVGGGGGDTNLGNLYQHWDLESIRKIPGGLETAKQIEKEVIDGEPEGTTAVQIALNTVLGRIPGRTPPYGHVIEVGGILEYNYIQDLNKMWGIV